MCEASQWGVEKVNFAVIPAPERESRVSTITLPCRLRFLMQTNLFNYPVMQTVVFTLILWILDQVEDDKRSSGVIIPLPIVIPASERESRVVGMTLLSLRASRQAWPKQSSGGLYCHSCARGNPGLVR